MEKENAALRGEVDDLKQQVANLERYVNEGVAFRDELQADLSRYREAVEWAYKELSANEFSDEWWNSNADSYSAWVAKELRRRAGEG